MSLNLEDVTASYVKVRDQVAELKKQITEKQVVLDKFESYFLKVMQDTGQTGLKTAAGTVSKSTRSTVSVADKDAFFDGWVLPNKAWEFMNVSANKSSVEAYKEAHEGDLPPGLNWTEVVTISVRRPTK